MKYLQIYKLNAVLMKTTGGYILYVLGEQWPFPKYTADPSLVRRGGGVYSNMEMTGMCLSENKNMGP